MINCALIGMRIEREQQIQTKMQGTSINTLVDKSKIQIYKQAIILFHVASIRKIYSIEAVLI